MGDKYFVPVCAGWVILQLPAGIFGIWARLSFRRCGIGRCIGNEISEAAHVADEIRQADFGSGPGESDGTDDSHVLVVLLRTEDMLDADAGFAAFVIAPFEFRV